MFARLDYVYLVAGRASLSRILYRIARVIFTFAQIVPMKLDIIIFNKKHLCYILNVIFLFKCDFCL